MSTPKKIQSLINDLSSQASSFIGHFSLLQLKAPAQWSQKGFLCFKSHWILSGACSIKLFGSEQIQTMLIHACIKQNNPVNTWSVVSINSEQMFPKSWYPSLRIFFIWRRIKLCRIIPLSDSNKMRFLFGLFSTKALKQMVTIPRKSFTKTTN